MRTIVLVDDSEAILHAYDKLLPLCLEIGACEIKVFNNAEEALDFCKSQDIDIIVSDYNLGDGMNGLEFCKQIKAVKSIIFIAVTGNDEVIKHFKQAGAELSFLKPLAVIELAAEIEKILK